VEYPLINLGPDSAAQLDNLAALLTTMSGQLASILAALAAPIDVKASGGIGVFNHLDLPLEVVGI